MSPSVSLDQRGIDWKRPTFKGIPRASPGLGFGLPIPREQQAFVLSWAGVAPVRKTGEGGEARQSHGSGSVGQGPQRAPCQPS